MYRFLILAMFAIPAVPALAQVVSYEATAFPEANGWTHTVDCTPERWLEDGRLFQFLEEDASACGAGDAGDRDSYTRTIDDFIGIDHFFVEWRVQATGDRSEVDLTAPASLVAWSFGGTNYHFTISRDLVRIIRDNLLPILLIEITPGVDHTYRIDLTNNLPDPWYELYIDADLIDEGVAEGVYPSSTPSISWRGRVWFFDSLNQWDFVRYGRTPDDGSGDFDSSGVADAFDLFYFAECIERSAAGEPADPSCQWADFNADNTVDCVDAAAFAAIYAGDPTDLNFTQCNPIPALSDWGLAVMVLLILTLGTYCFKARHTCGSGSWNH